MGNLFNLKDGDGGGEDCVDGKEDVWRSDRKNTSGVLRVIFFLQETSSLSSSSSSDDGFASNDTVLC